MSKTKNEKYICTKPNFQTEEEHEAYSRMLIHNFINYFLLFLFGDRFCNYHICGEYIKFYLLRTVERDEGLQYV